MIGQRYEDDFVLPSCYVGSTPFSPVPTAGRCFLHQTVMIGNCNFSDTSRVEDGWCSRARVSQYIKRINRQNVSAASSRPLAM